MNTIRVVIADDHPVFRYGLRALLLAEPATELVGEAENGDQAIELAATVNPDVILMDITMPDTDGLEATRTIVATSPQCRIVVLTMLEDDEMVFAAMRAGARGYIVKGASTEEILGAITLVHAGDLVFGAAIASRLLVWFNSPRTAAAAASSNHPFPELSAREREVVSLLAAGYTNAAIADRLYLSSKTVRNHVSAVFAKLQVSDRGQAIVRAREAGLG